MYRRLLVPLDGSRLAETVLVVVERLAAVYRATVVLLHVIERGAPATVHGERHLRTAVEVALGPAQERAGHLGAGLHLVMVVATLGTGRGERQALAQALPMATRAELDLVGEDARRYLEEVADRLRAGGTAVTVEVRRGDTLSALAAEAAEAGVGLVVMATHGRAGVQAIWAGSMATRLLARTRVPLLLLRRIEADDRSVT